MGNEIAKAQQALSSLLRAYKQNKISKERYEKESRAIKSYLYNRGVKP